MKQTNIFSVYMDKLLWVKARERAEVAGHRSISAYIRSLIMKDIMEKKNE